MRHDTKEKTAQILIEEALKPFILRIYEQANLTLPAAFDGDSEAVRCATALRTQGFNTMFPVVRKQS